MTVVGWIVFSVVTLLVIIIGSYFENKTTIKPIYRIIALTLAVVLSIGAFFGIKAIFGTQKVEVPIVENGTVSQETNQEKN